ncbi:MAG: hypothetical protein KHW57_05835 [Clostridium sp.]|nr:hypothetical protein [Clostridium sp.]
MNEIAEKDVINIENMIYEIDGKEGRKMRPQILVQNPELILEYLLNKECICSQQF